MPNFNAISRRTVLRGLYGAEVELVYLVAGMFHPKRLGIVQLYGVIGRSQTIEEAERRATNCAAALQASMSAAATAVRSSTGRFWRLSTRATGPFTP